MSKPTTVEQVRSLMKHLEPIAVNDSNTNGQLGTRFLSMESGSADDVVDNASDALKQEIIMAVKNAGLENVFSAESTNFDLAAQSAIIATNPIEASKPISTATPSHVQSQINSQIPNSSFKRSFSAESYNEKDIDVFQRAGIVMSLMSQQQSAASKLFFKPLAIDPREAGIITPVTVNMVFNNFRHATDGSLAEMGRKLAVRGHVDPKIFHNNLTKLVPVYRKGGNRDNVKSFVAEDKYKPREEDLGGGSKVITSMLTVDTEHNIIGISQTNQKLNNGLADSSTTISDVIRLDELLIDFGDEAYVVNTRGIVGHVFEPKIQGEKRRTELKFDTDSIVIPAGTLTSLDEEATGSTAIFKDYDIRIKTYVNGYVVLTNGITRITNASVQLHAANDIDGNPVTDDVFKQLADVVNKGNVIGFKLDANEENLNLREIGLLTETTTNNLLVTIPYREAVSNMSTTYEENFDFESALASIVTIHRMKADGEAINTLHNWFKLLDNYRAVIDSDGWMPTIDCVGYRAGIIPTSHKATIDAQEIVDGVRSAHRVEDIKHALLNYVHTIAMNLIVDSEFTSVAQSFGAGADFKPKVIIVTDQIIHSYLSPKFDTIIERDEYTVEIASTVNNTMYGKMYIGLTDSNDNTVGNILSPLVFGNYAHGPDMVSNLNRSLSANNTSRFITATPRYFHITNVPVMGMIDVKNVHKLANKLPINFREVQ